MGPVVAFGVHLVEQFEVRAVGREALDLVQVARLLGAEIVAGEAQHRQALGGIGLVEGLQTRVLLGEATAVGHVHDQQHLAGVIAQDLLLPSGVVTETSLTLIAMVKQGWSAVNRCNGHTLGSRPEGHDGGIGAGSAGVSVSPTCWPRRCPMARRDPPGGQLRRGEAAVGTGAAGGHRRSDWQSPCQLAGHCLSPASKETISVMSTSIRSPNRAC